MSYFDERCHKEQMEALAAIERKLPDLRDYFAAKAMAALLVDPERVDQSREQCARLSYLMADAMIQAKKGTP